MLAIVIWINIQESYAQPGSPLQGLEGIVVETYAIHPENKSGNSANGSLPKGYITYRIFVDLAPGFKLQILYGTVNQPLRVETTTRFFNDPDFGAVTGNEINESEINGSNLAFDSWISMGGATRKHLGIIKREDTDGSVIKSSSFSEKDGLIAGSPRQINYFNLNPAFFQYADSSLFAITNGAWSVFEGVTGPTSSNCILIAQLTTDGAISLALNIQLLSPDKKVMRFVSVKPGGDDIFFKGLMINLYKSNHYGTNSFKKD
jgi:hypothetical protein